jgi:hypothetical protein
VRIKAIGPKDEALCHGSHAFVEIKTWQILRSGKLKGDFPMRVDRSGKQRCGGPQLHRTGSL